MQHSLGRICKAIIHSDGKGRAYMHTPAKGWWRTRIMSHLRFFVRECDTRSEELGVLSLLAIHVSYGFPEWDLVKHFIVSHTSPELELH